MASGRKRSETTLGGWEVLTVPRLPACATSLFPEPRTLNPTSHSRPVPPHFIPPPPRDLGMGGQDGASLWIVRLGLGLRENAHVQKW